MKLISRKIKSFGGNLEHYAIARVLMIRVYTLEPKTPAPPIYTVMLVILVSQQASWRKCPIKSKFPISFILLQINKRSI